MTCQVCESEEKVYSLMCGHTICYNHLEVESGNVVCPFCDSQVKISQSGVIEVSIGDRISLKGT